MTAILLAGGFSLASLVVAGFASGRALRARTEAEHARSARLHQISWALIIIAVTMLVVGGIHIALVTP